MIKDISFLFKPKTDITEDIVENKNSPISTNATNVLYKSGEVEYYSDVMWKQLKKKITDSHIETIVLENAFTYSPYQLSMELYGTPIIGDYILRLNDMVSIYEFKSSQIKVFNEQGIEFIVNEIILTSQTIKKYKYNQSYIGEYMTIKKI